MTESFHIPTLRIHDIDNTQSESNRKWLILPAIADEILATRNAVNRPLGERDVDAIARDIINNHYRTTHQGIAFNAAGQLQDGQHRLAACVRSNIGIVTYVAFGMAYENFEVVDGGKSRTHPQRFGFEHVPYPEVHSGSLKLVLSEREGMPTNRHKYVRYTYSELKDRYAQLPNFTDGVLAVVRIIGNKRPLMSHGLAAYIWHRLAQIDKDECKNFFTYLSTGEALVRGDPVFTLRAFLHTIREDAVRKVGRVLIDPLKIYPAVIKAWNYVRDGKSLHAIRVTPGERVVPH